MFQQTTSVFVKVVKAKSAKMQGARTRARAREVQKTKTGSTIKHSSEVRFVILQATNKNTGRFPKNVRHFPKNVGDFFKNVGDFRLMRRIPKVQYLKDS